MLLLSDEYEPGKTPARALTGPIDLSSPVDRSPLKELRFSAAGFSPNRQPGYRASLAASFRKAPLISQSAPADKTEEPSRVSLGSLRGDRSEPTTPVRSQQTPHTSKTYAKLFHCSSLNLQCIRRPMMNRSDFSMQDVFPSSGGNSRSPPLSLEDPLDALSSKLAAVDLDDE